MKTMLVALAIALVPLNVTTTPARLHAGSSSLAAPAERPTICFEFAFWKYCI